MTDFGNGLKSYAIFDSGKRNPVIAPIIVGNPTLILQNKYDGK
jgi:hypothetical protein